ncbi:MAG TPA: penicillin-binding protein 1B [Steroidobacteraceae bacterium]|nr:penicillin-binding protein 1B [Steroidobacteraceae bacterium]
MTEAPPPAIPAQRSLRTRVVVGAILGLLVAGIGYLVVLDQFVMRRFEARSWTVPAQVFAQPLELSRGAALSPGAVEEELTRLGYRSAGQVTESGTYRRHGEVFEVMLRKARFDDEVREAQRLRIVTRGRSIVGLTGARDENLVKIRLDPLLIGNLYLNEDEDRIVVAPGEMPALLPATLKAIEDRDFDSHAGIDLSAIARAAWTNLRAGRIEQGGSTLTQQLVKSYFLDARRTFGRKAQEALMAVLLESHFSKDDILSAYINDVYLGQDGARAIHGFGLASRFYFAKPANELTLPEIALLVGIVRGPSYYNPRTQATRAKARRDFVLTQLAQLSIVTETDAREAKAQPLGVVARSGDAYYPAYLDYVRRTLPRDYRAEDLERPGLQIFTSLDPRVQAVAERTLDEQLERLDRQHKSKPQALEGAIVVTAPQSAEVVAVVGGRQAQAGNLNRALDAHRSIGSLVKPIVYLAALETGRYHAASLIYDEPVQVQLANGKYWQPANFDQHALGAMPLVRALAESRNLATVQLGLDVGLDNVARKFTALGLDREPARVPALLLGAVDLAPMEVAQIYNSFANGGYDTPLRAVRAVTTSDGRRVEAIPRTANLVADPGAVYQLDRMMTEVMSHGTGLSATSKLPVELVTAGKSGTSSNFRDSWFAGFSGSHLAVVWVGNDDNAPTGLTGSRGALPVWSSVMAQVATRSWNPPMPDSLEETWINYESGLAADEGCAEDVIPVALPQGTELDSAHGCGGLHRFARRVAAWWHRL